MEKLFNSSIVVNTNTNNVINVNKLGSVIGNVLALNSAASNMYGVPVKWFRSIPQDRSKDVLFMEWTLYNVEDCPLNLNVIHNDASYDEATLTYNMMGIEYSIPLTMSISILDWQKVTNNDGSVPSKGDIVYIPQSNRLYEVASMTPQKTVASQITSYKVNLQKYQPKRNRILGDNLTDTIDTYTNSIEKLFGEDIKEEIQDAINDKQTSPHNTTPNKDKYKKLISNNIIVDKDIICDGHTISKSYYSNSSFNNFLVYYKNINDNIEKTDERTFSCLFSIKNDNEKVELKNISYIKKNVNYHYYKCILPYNYNCIVSIGNNLIQLNGEYNYKNKELKISNKLIDIYGEDWYDDNSIKCSNTKNNLLSSSEINIDFIGDYSYVLYIKGKEYIFNSDVAIEKNKWYNIVFKLGKTSILKIFDTNNNLKLLYEEELNTKKWDNISNNEYYIKGGDNNITNIRLYNIGFDSDEKYISNAITYLGNDDSKLLISDNADLFFNHSYYGNPR